MTRGEAMTMALRNNPGSTSERLSELTRMSIGIVRRMLRSWIDRGDVVRKCRWYGGIHEGHTWVYYFADDWEKVRRA